MATSYRRLHYKHKNHHSLILRMYLVIYLFLKKTPPVLTKWGLRSTGLTQAPAVTLYAKNHAHTRTQIHAEWVILKPKICLAPMLFWHSIWQSFKSLLHPLVEPKHQKKQTAAVGIKVSVGVCARACVHLTYSTVLSVVCESSWLFGMLRISHCSSPLQAGKETER